MSSAKHIADASERIGPDQLSKRRADAAAHFAAAGFPTTRMEDWKYTDLSLAEKISLEALDTDSRGKDIDAALPDVDATWLLIRNGRPDSDIQGIDGVAISLLSEADRELRFDLPLADLNLALLSDGLSLEIAPGAKIEKPIGLMFLSGADERPIVSQGRVLIDIGDNASVEIVEFHQTAGGAEKYANVLVELELGAGAQTRYARIQDGDEQSVLTNRLHVELGRDAVFEHFALDVGGRLVRNDLAIDITQPGAAASFDGLYLADRGQHIDNHTRVDHRTGPAQSRQEYRGIIRGRAVWNGKAIVHEGADGTDAEQANHNLLLAKKAEVDAKPELEIYAEEVKCSHGTTVGQLDDDAVFYLRTRGIDEEKARQLMIQAFATGVVERCPVEALSGWVHHRVDEALARLDLEEGN